jgi:sulfur carrier protein ThiS
VRRFRLGGRGLTSVLIFGYESSGQAFRLLSQDFPGYDPEKGLEAEIPDGARVKDLLDHLGISETKGGVVSVDGMIFRPEHPLKEGHAVHLFQAVCGG